MKKINIKIVVFLLAAVSFVACDDFLDREPLSDITPTVYFRQEGDLQAYVMKLYNFPTHGGYNLGTFTRDNNTDNQASYGASVRWLPGEWKVKTGEALGKGDWDFVRIRTINRKSRKC